MSLSVVFALAGMALIALAAFGPRKVELDNAVSFAPPLAQPPRVRWPRPVGWYPPRPGAARPTAAAAEPPQPAWPERIDPKAARADRETRLVMVEALDALRTPWAETMLRAVLPDENDPLVRAAALRALAAYAGSP